MAATFDCVMVNTPVYHESTFEQIWQPYYIGDGVKAILPTLSKASHAH